MLAVRLALAVAPGMANMAVEAVPMLAPFHHPRLPWEADHPEFAATLRG
jgi:hypothetical protein